MQTKKNLPIAIIIIGVVLAAGLALLLQRRSDGEAANPANADATKGAKAAASLNPDTGGGHVKGNPNARVTLVEYGDFQCPSCAYYHPIVTGLLDGSPDLVKLEFHHYPLIQMHPNAFPAALAAEAAADQGRFWEMFELLFQSQSSWSAKPKAQAEEDFLVMAEKLGLDSNKFMQSMRAPETSDRVLRDVTRGNEVGVQGTPSFFVNGRALHPLPSTVQGFQDAVQDGLASK